MSAAKVKFDSLRSIGFASISAAYAAIGSALTVNGRIMIITNKTQGDMIISDDSADSSGKIFIPAGVSRVYDFETNMKQNRDDSFELAKGTQFYVKQVTAPVSGSVYLEFVYA